MKLLPVIPAVIFCLFFFNAYSQNIAITDDNGYTAAPSAMLDVKSTSKGMLVPRLSSSQRAAISSPANGLLVFDTTVGSFFFYNSGAWLNLSVEGEIWSKNGINVYTTDNTYKVGVGTSTPVGKMEVKADGLMGLNEPIFEVINTNGDTVFAVYNEGVRINVQDNPVYKAAGSRGGFAVGGFSNAKGANHGYLWVTPDSVRVYIDDEFIATKSTGSRGGFAVGGFSNAKGTITDNYLFVQDDSTRVYVNDSTAGFGVASIQSGNDESFIDMTTENCFLGHQSGLNTIPGPVNGIYNSFLGYQTGMNNTFGSRNVFVGYQCGFSNQWGSKNSFIGYQSGYSNTSGQGNVFHGNVAGRFNQDGNWNVFIGNYSGYFNISGDRNIFIGYESGMMNTTGAANVFLGDIAGTRNTTGYYNTFLGRSAGSENTIGFQNVYIGTDGGHANVNGNYNTTLGNSASYWNNGGSQNVISGFEAGKGTFGATNYSNNTFYGYQSGYKTTTGTDNTYIGHLSGFNNQTGNDNVFIGKFSGYTETGSGKLYISINDEGKYNSLVYGEFYNEILGFNGNVGVRTITPNTTFSVYNIYKSSVLSNFTQNVSNTGMNIITGYTSGTYTPGLFWSSEFDNPTKPKAGIWMYQNTLGTDLCFGTSNSYATGITNTAMIISESGTIGINTMSPDNMLDVNGKISVTQTVNDEMVIINSNTWQHFNGNQVFGTGGDYFIMASKEGSGESAGIRGDGNNVAIWSPGDGSRLVRFLDEDAFDASDTDPYNNNAEKAYIDAAGQYFQVSDADKKQNIERIENASEKLSSINGYNYEYKLLPSEIEKGQTPTVASGILAQELKLVLPQAVSENENGDMFVNYSAIIPLLLEALKEHQSDIGLLKETNTELLDKLSAVEVELGKLKNK